MARILVIEDELDVLNALELQLRRAGHTVQAVRDGSAGLAVARDAPPDLVVLDVTLPDLSGLELCKALRNDPVTSSTRVIILSPNGDEVERVLAFELGADDYVTKPFSMRELLLRARALTRNPPLKGPEGGAFTFGVLEVDRGAHRAWVDGGEAALTAIEFKLLLVLHDRRNRVQTREALLADVWGLKGSSNTRTVDTHGRRLREKLGRAGDYIATIRGVGYRFAAEPQEPSKRARASRD
jgi:two-component system phosphate regulon response regulator PhoB